MQTPAHKMLSTADNDRRRSPRVSCMGQIQIIRLPSDGPAFPGRLLNLSLGGCGLETTFPLEGGTRVEVLLRVNSLSFRAFCQVQAFLAPQRMGVQFLRLGGIGQTILAELMRELATQRARSTASRMIHCRPDPDRASPRILSVVRSPVTPEGNQITLLPPETLASNDVKRLFAKRANAISVNELDLFI